VADPEWLNVILGAGGVGIIGAGYKAVKDWRESTWQHGGSAMSDLERWRRNADESREWEAAQHQWWRDRAAELEYVLIARLGPEALPEKPPYPQRPSFAERERQEKRA
jgi:hypothetical protein